MSAKEIELKNYVDIPKRKKRGKKQNNNTLEKYDPSINDATPIQFGGYDLYCDDPSTVLIDMYSIIFNKKDDFIKRKTDPRYWDYIITEIQDEEHTGIIKNSIINKTEAEKIKSIIKLFKVISSRIDYE
jgi:hypothetical protein